MQCCTIKGVDTGSDCCRFFTFAYDRKRFDEIGCAIAAVSASALAIGVSVTSLTTDMTTDVNSYMFGSILAMTKDDVILCVLLSCVVLALFIVSYHNIFAVTFERKFWKGNRCKSFFL